jgi:hypothetical protein
MLQTYWLIPFRVSSHDDDFQTVSVKTPKDGIPPNAGVRSYTVLSEYYEIDDEGIAVSRIDSFVQNGTPKPGDLALAAGPGVTEVTAVAWVANASVVYLFITDIFE